MPRKPKIRNTEIVATSRLFKIEAVSLQFENGEQRVFERIRGSAHLAVFVIVMLDEETLALAKEYAVGFEDYQIGLCKGLVDPGEDVLTAANRELQEELGYAANSLEHLFDMYTSPGYLSSKFSVVFACDCYPCKLEGDEPEPIELVKWPVAQIDKLIERDDVNDARVIATLLRFKQWFEKNQQRITFKGAKK